MPLEWFAYPQAISPLDGNPPPGSKPHLVPGMLSAAYLAGVPNRPTTAEFAKILRASELNDAQALIGTGHPALRITKPDRRVRE